MMPLELRVTGERILIDAREFIPGRYTGIARVLEGLVAALSEAVPIEAIFLAAYSAEFTPSRLRTRKRIRITEIPKSYIRAENFLSDLSRSTHLFISPYPKLPLFGVHCRAIHIVHDVLDLTHPFYRKRLRVIFDRYRIKRALHRADITWYDSSWSMAETLKHFGWGGRNPKVRHPGIQNVFQPVKQKEEDSILEAYGLKEGYVLALGNGRPHKNLGILLDIAPQIGRRIVFAGVSENQQRYWESRHRGIRAKWIRHVGEQHLPALLRGAFCLAQPSLVEGYGYPPLEAMACGRPAVISRIPVLVETTGGYALTADTNDAKEWIEAFRALENTPIYREKVQEGLNWLEPLRGAKGWNSHIEDIQKLLLDHHSQTIDPLPSNA
jgi:glycosyltransferase involved in cell wall biosynthesis